MTLQTGAQRKETWDMGCPSRCRNELAGALRHEETEQIVGQHIAVFKKRRRQLQAFGAHHNDCPSAMASSNMIHDCSVPFGHLSHLMSLLFCLSQSSSFQHIPPNSWLITSSPSPKVEVSGIPDITMCTICSAKNIDDQPLFHLPLLPVLLLPLLLHDASSATCLLVPSLKLPDVTREWLTNLAIC